MYQYRISEKANFRRNFSKIQKVSNMYLFISVLPLFILAFFFFFFDRFLILLTFHLFCSSSSRHRLLVALNYRPIKLDYPYMRFYITMNLFTMMKIHERSWAMNHEPFDDDQNWACRITEYWTEKKEWAGFTHPKLRFKNRISIQTRL